MAVNTYINDRKAFESLYKQLERGVLTGSWSAIAPVLQIAQQQQMIEALQGVAKTLNRIERTLAHVVADAGDNEVAK